MKKYNMLIAALLVLATVRYRDIMSSDWLYLVIAGLGLLLACGIAWLVLAQKRSDFVAWFYFIGVILLVILFGIPFLLLLLVPLLLKGRIESWLDKRRRAASPWQPPVSDAEFLAGCGIAADSPEAETAPAIRRELAKEITGWTKHPTEPEDIAPDMLCRELMRDWNWSVYCREGYSFGVDAVRKATAKNPLPPEAFDLLIQPENKPRTSVSKLIRNYLNVIAAYSSEKKT